VACSAVTVAARANSKIENKVRKQDNMATSQGDARESRNCEGHGQLQPQAFKSDSAPPQAIILVASHNIGTSDSHGRGNTGHCAGVKLTLCRSGIEGSTLQQPCQLSGAFNQSRDQHGNTGFVDHCQIKVSSRHVPIELYEHVAKREHHEVSSSLASDERGTIEGKMEI
jgi:hypothetical protein